MVVNDTEYLAELLREALYARAGTGDNTMEAVAARLIAAGVTIAPDPAPPKCPCGHGSSHYTGCLECDRHGVNHAERYDD